MAQYQPKSLPVTTSLADPESNQAPPTPRSWVVDTPLLFYSNWL